MREFHSGVYCASQGPIKGQPSHTVDSKREHLIQRSIKYHRALESEGINYLEIDIILGHIGIADVKGSHHP